MTTKKTIIKIAQACIERAENCPDYGKKGKKSDEMALNFFCGAHALALIEGNQPLADHITKVVVFSVGLRGMNGVREIASWIDEEKGAT